MITQSGRYTKVPFIDAVTYFVRSFDVNTPPGVVLTGDKRRLAIDSYVRFTIVDPLLFFRTVGTEGLAKFRMTDILASELRLDIARHSYAEIMQANDGGFKMRVRASAAPKLRQIGIEIADMTINVRPSRP